MNEDYLKLNNSEFREWILNYRNKLPDAAKELGLSEQELEDGLEWCEMMLASINNAEQTKLAYKIAIKDKEQTVKEGRDFIRGQVKLIKASRAYKPSLGEMMNIISPSNKFNPDMYKPKIKVTKTPDGIKISFIKGLTHGVNIYRRTKNSDDWTFINRDNRSPYLDKSQLNGHHEYEYRVRAVIDDEEIGFFSDVVLVTV